MKVPEVKYAVKVPDHYLAAFISVWIQYDKPCSLLWKKAKTEGFTAAVVVVNNDDAVYFLSKAVKDYNFEIREI